MKAIYKIINKLNNKYYVGSSMKLKDRWSLHKRKLLTGTHYNIHLQNAWNKDGKDNFIFVVVENCEQSLTNNDLLGIEQKYLDIAKTEQDKCYNFTFVAGGGNLGKDVNKKISNSLTGKMSGEKNPMFGKIHSNETKQKWSLLRKGRFSGKDSPNFGKTYTDERRIKISHSLKGRSAWNKGIKTDTSRLVEIHTKDWIFISPDNKVVSIHNLKKFCREHNLNPANMRSVSLGIHKQCKGWKKYVLDMSKLE